MIKMNIIKRKSAQMQMAETVAIMIVFFFLIIIVVSVYSKIERGNMEKTVNENFVRESIDIAQAVSALPEIQCSRDNVIEDNCFDYYKLKAFNISLENKSKRLYYYDRLKYSRIYVKFTGAFGGNREEIEIYDFPKPNFQRRSSIQIPITVMHPALKQKKFGILFVELYR